MGGGRLFLSSRSLVMLAKVSVILLVLILGVDGVPLLPTTLFFGLLLLDDVLEGFDGLGVVGAGFFAGWLGVGV